MFLFGKLCIHMAMSAYPDVRVEPYSFLTFFAIKAFLIINLFSNI